MFYLILALILFLCALLHIYKGSTTISRRKRVVLFLCFWLVAGLAYQTGVDWKVYSSVFEQSLPLGKALSSGSFQQQYAGISTEPGYSLISSLVISLTDDYQILQLVVLLIASIFFFKAVSKYTQNLYLVLLVYLGYVYLTLNMSGIRQALSLSIIFYALQYIESKQFWRFLFFVVLAIMFHYSSLVVIPLYWVLNKKFSTPLICMLVGVGLLVYVARISIISSTIEQITQSSGNPVLYRMYLYVTGTKDALPSISPKMFLNVISLVMLLLRRDILIEQNRYSNIFFNLFLFYVLLGQYMWDTGDIVVRIQHYFILGLIVMLPIYADSLKYMGNKIIMAFFVLALSLWSSNPIFLGQQGGLPYNPYQNYVLYQISGRQSTGEERLRQWED